MQLGWLRACLMWLALVLAVVLQSVLAATGILLGIQGLLAEETVRFLLLFPLLTALGLSVIWGLYALGCGADSSSNSKHGSQDADLEAALLLKPMEYDQATKTAAVSRQGKQETAAVAVQAAAARSRQCSHSNQVLPVQASCRVQQPQDAPATTVSAESQQLQQQQTPVHTPVCGGAASGAHSNISSSSNSGGSGCDDATVDVWIMAGQSNSVGSNGPDGQLMPEGAAPWPGRILAYNNRAGMWHDAVPNIHLHVYGYNDAYSCGPDMAFARTLIQTGAAHKVGLVPTAMGGTNLFDQWAPGNELWRNMCDDTAAAMQALGGRGRLRGVIWIQGESDGAATEQEALEYGTNLTAWVKATRFALAAYHPQLPVVMVVMATRQRHFAFRFIDVVRAQQQALKLPGLLKIDMAGYEFFEQDFYGRQQLIHLSKSGCCALGAAMAFEVVTKMPTPSS